MTHLSLTLARSTCTVFLSLVALVLGGILLAPPAHGQAALEVHAVNVEANTPAADVTVHLINDEIGVEAERTTDEQGRIEWRGLSTAGQYTVAVEDNDRFYATRSTATASTPPAPRASSCVPTLRAV